MSTRSNRTNNEELRIVMVGKTGIGKSATGNTILGRQCFESKFSSKSMTVDCSKGKGTVDGQKVAVIDTPGLFDTRFGMDKTAADLTQCISYAAPGPHVFLVVIRLGRYTEEEKQTVQKTQDIFGQAADKYSMVLFTGGDLLEDQTIEDFIDENQDLQELVGRCNDQYHVFNNKKKDHSQVTELLQKIRSIVQKNGGSHYTNEMFQEAERANEEEKQRILKEKEEQIRKEREELEREVQQKYEQQMKKIREELQAERERERQEWMREKQEMIEERKREKQEMIEERKREKQEMIEERKREKQEMIEDRKREKQEMIEERKREKQEMIEERKREKQEMIEERKREKQEMIEERKREKQEMTEERKREREERERERTRERQEKERELSKLKKQFDSDLKKQVNKLQNQHEYRDEAEDSNPLYHLVKADQNTVNGVRELGKALKSLFK